MTIAVTGASGNLGRLTIEALKKRVSSGQIVALARSPEKVADLGVEVRKFDYDQSDALALALKGVDTLILISGNALVRRVEQHHNVIEAAREAGVKHILYTSVLHNDTSSLYQCADHRETEAELKGCGIPVSLMRNSLYSEVFLMMIDGAQRTGEIVRSAGEGRIASAARADFAEALAIVATAAPQGFTIYELAGDEAWTMTELAAELSRQVGKEVRYRNVPVEEYAGVFIQMGLPEARARQLASIDTSIEEGAVFDDSRQLSGLLGRPTKPIKDVIAEALV